MNNKRLGTEFERQMCEILARKGYWVHFIVPDARGAQPFDIIACRGDRPLAIDCKTSSTHRFNSRRIEDNQHMAFRRWMDCGNGDPLLAVKYGRKIYLIPYPVFLNEKVVDLNARRVWEEV